MEGKMKQDQLDKLPAYAKAEITRLRAEVARLKAKNEWLEDQNRLAVDASNTAVVEGLDHKTALPPFSEVEFSLDPQDSKRWRSTVLVRLNRDGRSIQIMGTAAMVIIPQVTNVIHIALKD